jgi:SAM-dependent methyltransferase
MKHTEVYQNGEDNGWLTKQNFWFDPEHEHGFAIQDLDGLYPEKYFEQDHVKPETIDNYCRLVPEFYKNITGKNLNTIIEIGCGGGWFSKRFQDLGYDITAIEGSKAGFEAAKKRGVNRVFQFDLRHSFSYPYSRDIALCTEVAEHIEPPFSSELVSNLVHRSSLVWFSFEEPNTNAAHVHHCNEMPAKFWINLFDFYGYGAYKLPQWVYDQCEGRGMYIFYKKSVYENNPFFNETV